MDVELIVFLALGAMTLLSSIMVLEAKEIVHSVFYLAITFIAVAGIFIMFNAEFLALIQIFINVGAVVVLILFAIMLTRRTIIVRREPQ